MAQGSASHTLQRGEENPDIGIKAFCIMAFY
jgi:hypothetical protein